MDLTRVLVTTKVTLSQSLIVDGQLTDADGDVAVTVTRLDGTEVTTGTATRADLGRYTYAPPAQTQLDALLVTWAATLAGAPVVLVDLVEVVGGFLFGLTAARDKHKAALASYSEAALADARITVEQEAERISGRAFVPRFARYLLNGSGTDELVTPDVNLRVLRAAKVADRAGGSFVDLSVDELAAVATLPEGILARDDGNTWPRGRSNVLVEYEYGLDMPPKPARDAGIMRLRSVLAASKTSIPDRAISFTVQEGGVYRLGQAAKDSTGYPDIDAAYKGAGRERVWLA